MEHQTMREVKLPSGAVLKIAPGTFAQSKTLWEAVLKVLRGVPITGTGNLEMVDLYKNLFADGFTSPEVQAALWPCLQHCLYNDGTGDVKIEQSVFEPVAARQDMLKVFMEVTKENIDPFLKGLYAEYGNLLNDLTKGFQASRPQPTT